VSGRSIGQALAEASEILAGLPQASPRLEAEILLAHVLGKPRTHLIAWPEKLLEEPQLKAFQRLIERRLQGEPIAHLTGWREFWSLPLRVTADTLIPRPDSELLVELAVARIPRDQPCLAADLGTGSGAIAAAIASERPQARIIAIERSARALAVAQANFIRLQLNNVQCLQGDWCRPLAMAASFDLIVSNPPYIPAADPHLQQEGLPWEPADALIAGTDGLDAIRRITAEAMTRLRPGAWLLLEHGWDQGEAVRRLLQQAGYKEPRTWQDLEGRDRVSGGRRSI